MHFHRNVFTAVPNGKMRKVARMLKVIHAQEDPKEATAKAEGAETVGREEDLRGTGMEVASGP